MANNYSQFSTVISDLTQEEKNWIVGIPCFDDFIGSAESEEDGERLAKEFVEALAEYGIAISTDDEYLDVFPNFLGDIDSEGKWWLYAEEAGNLDHLSRVVQGFINKFRPDFIFTLTWADTCSKLRVNAFGGGWLAVSRDEVVFGNVYDAAEQAAAELRAKLARRAADA